MKKILSLSVALMTASSFVIAGGNIAPIEEPIIVEEIEETVNADAGFYLGLAYGALSHERDRNTINEDITSDAIDETYSEIMLQVGYKFNPYIAIEGRYWYGLDDTLEGGIADHFGAIVDVSTDVWGIYLKPMYPVTDAFDIYALLGYGSTEYDVTTEHAGIKGSLDMSFDGFTCGLGVSYAFTENISAFVDYTRIYDDTTDYVTPNGIALNFDDTIDIVSIGLTYNF